MIITPVSTASDEGRRILHNLSDRFQLADSTCRQTVAEIIAEVRARGDAALIDYTRKFDSPAMAIERLRVSEEELTEAFSQVDDAFMETLELAIERVYLFHEREKEQSWLMTRDDGAITGRLVHPVDSAGLYVPGGQGGKTPLVSSVLMNGIPAAIAGVARRVMMTPADAEGKVNPALLVAAQEIGITEIYKAGSAWAIAALAYGTETVPAVDVIVGPGNQYVTEAKRQVSGRVRIDMIAGPSEILVIADDSADPEHVAADLLSQAEHDPLASAILVTDSAETATAVQRAVKRQVAELERRDIAEQSLQAYGALFVVHDLSAAVALANRIAPEHLELQVRDPFAWVGRIRHAGALFVGPHTPEPVGDYVAGPNHVLPTAGTARFSSALSVEDFIKTTSLIHYSPEALRAEARDIIRLAQIEGLEAHARSVQVRLSKARTANGKKGAAAK